MWMMLSLFTPSRCGSGVDRRGKGVVRVHDALGLSGGAGGEHQQRHVVGVRAQRGQLGRITPLLPRGGRERLPGRIRVAGLSVDDEHVLQVRPRRPKPIHHRRVVKPTELPGDDQDLGFGEADHEPDLAVPVDRDQRVADRTDAGGREVDHQELDPVGELEGDHVARADAELQEAERGSVDLGHQLGVGDLPAGVDRGGLVRGAVGGLVEEVGDDAVGPVAGGGVLADGLRREDRLERHRRSALSSSSGRR